MKRLALFVLAAICLFALLPMPGRVAGTVQKQTTRAISIAFDNSGSMYGDGSGKPLTRWCQAIYAMEVFAAMLNEGDQLQIYPMNDIEVNGAEYKANTPLKIRGGVDADVESIREIYTTTARWQSMTTPIQTVISAMEGLQQMTADEHWLIVLTDGDQFYDENNQAMSQSVTKSRLSQLLSAYNEEVNVLYLGIFDNKSQFSLVPEITGSTMRSMAEAAVSEDVPRTLSKMCNYIFQRDELPDDAKYKTNQSLSFDLPMKKLIVLVQGADVGEIRLEGGGHTFSADSSDGLKYSEKGCAAKAFDIDRSLQGTLATFTDVPAGSYELKYGGSASAVSAYYEPDVQLSVVLCDENSDPIREGQENYAGRYQIRYGLLDSSGNFTDSTLLGDTKYRIEYEINGVAQPPIEARGTGSFPLELGVGDSIQALHAEVKYLITPSRPDGYFMEKYGSELGWPTDGFNIVAHPVGTLRLDTSGGRSNYTLHEMEQQASYEIRLFYDEGQLTGDALKNAMIDLVIEGPGDLDRDFRQDGDVFRLQLKHKGDAADTVPGSYRIRLSASYTNDEGQTCTAAGQIGFELQAVSHSFTLELECPQNRYLVSELEKGEPLRAKLLLDGAPLSAEQLAAVEFTADGGKLVLDTERLPKESAVLIRIRPDKDLPEGKYTISAAATLPDELGRPMKAEAAAQVELKYPTHGFSLELECPQTDFVISELDAGQPLRARLLLDGAPLTAEQMAAVAFTADGGQLTLKTEKLAKESAVLISILPDDTLPEGSYPITVKATLPDELGRPMEAAGEAQVALRFPTHTFTLELENPQGYYVIMQLDDGEPLRAKLLLDGAPLTAEQLAEVRFTLDPGELTLDTELLPEESAWLIRIRPGASQPKGSHTIRASAELADELGHPMQSADKANVTLRTYPAWVPWVLSALILLLLLLLIWLYLNAKILPKSIRVGKTDYRVKNTRLSIEAPAVFSGRNSRRGELTIELPSYASDRTVSGGVTVHLEAVSPRRVKSSSRLARVVSDVDFSNEIALSAVGIGAAAFVKDAKTNQLVQRGIPKEGNPPPIDLCNNNTIYIKGKSIGGSSFSMTVTLDFS